MQPGRSWCRACRHRGLPCALGLAEGRWKVLKALVRFGCLGQLDKPSLPASHLPAEAIMTAALVGCFSIAVAPLAFLALRQAATKPAVQVLAFGITLASGLVATIVWQCAWCSAPAAVPILLAGKQLEAAATGTHGPPPAALACR